MPAAARAASTGLFRVRTGAANAHDAWFAAATSLSMVPNAPNGSDAVSGGGGMAPAAIARQDSTTERRVGMARTFPLSPSPCGRGLGGGELCCLPAAQSSAETCGQFTIHDSIAVELPPLVVAHHADQLGRCADP